MASSLKVIAGILAIALFIDVVPARTVDETFSSEEKCKTYALYMIEMRREQAIDSFHHGSGNLVSMWYDKHQNAEEHDVEFLKDLLTKLNKLRGDTANLLSNCISPKVANMKETIPQSCHRENNSWIMGEKERKNLHMGLNVCFYEAYKKLQEGYNAIKVELGLSDIIVLRE